MTEQQLKYYSPAPMTQGGEFYVGSSLAYKLTQLGLDNSMGDMKHFFSPTGNNLSIQTVNEGRTSNPTGRWWRPTQEQARRFLINRSQTTIHAVPNIPWYRGIVEGWGYAIVENLKVIRKHQSGYLNAEHALEAGMERVAEGLLDKTINLR